MNESDNWRDERAAECMRHYDHASLARMYVSMIRDFCEMQTAICRIMEESTDPATVKIARDAFMHIPPRYKPVPRTVLDAFMHIPPKQ